MKNKEMLVLMEQLIMMLVFALAAALCLRIFVQAKTISEETARYEEAMIAAQNTAQALKTTADPEKAEALIQSEPYTVQIGEKASGVPGLGIAEIVVSYEGEEICALITSWQEALP